MSLHTEANLGVHILLYGIEQWTSQSCRDGCMQMSCSLGCSRRAGEQLGKAPKRVAKTRKMELLLDISLLRGKKDTRCGSTEQEFTEIRWTQLWLKSLGSEGPDPTSQLFPSFGIQSWTRKGGSSDNVHLDFGWRYRWQSGRKSSGSNYNFYLLNYKWKMTPSFRVGENAKSSASKKPGK